MPKTSAKEKAEELTGRMDLLMPEERMRREIVSSAAGIGAFYGFEPIKTASAESAILLTPLIRQGLLDERPPVFCKTRAGEEIALSPSGILGVLRAYASHRLQALPHPVKMSFEADAFSAGAAAHRARPWIDPIDLYADGSGPSDGSMVLWREWGLVMVGEESAVAETEIIQALWKACGELGIGEDEMEARINATGCVHCRPHCRSSFSAFFRARRQRLCVKSRRDIAHNPTAILSCADERCVSASAQAPQALDFLCDRCKKHLRSALEFMDEARIPYFLDTRLFREGSWFCETIFVLLLRSPSGGVSKDRASESEHADPDSRPLLIAEGGRVSRAAGLFAGKDIAAVGGTLLLDALRHALGAKSESVRSGADVFFVQLGDLAKRKSFEILEDLREGGIEIRESLGRDSIKVQFKIAERLAARYALVLGQKEALDGTIIVREVQSGIQETVPQANLVEFLKKKLEK